MENLQRKLVDTILGMCEELDSRMGMDVEDCSREELMELNEDELISSFIHITEMVLQKEYESDEWGWGDDENQWGEDLED